MKKLIVAAALVMCAAASQAAYVCWNLTGVKEDGSNVNGLMYVINDAVLKRTTVLALAEQGADKVSSTLTDAANKTFAWTVADGKGSMSSSNSAKPTNAQLGMSDSTIYNLYAVVFDTATITDDSNFYVTALKSNTSASGESFKIWGFSASDSATASNWHAVNSIPEPTSGLLLLLGVAGLALRRRRA